MKNITNKSVVGEELLGEILTKADRELISLSKYEFQPYEGIYHINDAGDCVSEYDWNNYWSAFPEWYEKAYMITDNGLHTKKQVSKMSIEEIETIYNSPDFFPEYAFYTEADENGEV